MWETWLLAKELGVRPSVVLGLGPADSFTAYCIDRALWTFSRVIEDEQEKATDRLPQSAKPAAHQRARTRVLEKYLGIDPKVEGKFRSPG
jgi:hypothetical protein